MMKPKVQRSNAPPSRRIQPPPAGSAPKRMHWCYRCLLSCLVSFVLLILITIIRSDSIEPVHYWLPEPPQLAGALAENDILKDAERMFHHIIKGPESIIVHEGNLYTGTLFGKIMKIDKTGTMTTFAKLGKENCSSFVTCGRPLGMRLDKSKEFFYVADAYYGLYKVNLKTAKFERIFPVDNKFKVTFFDDLDILPNGDIVLSEASAKYPFHRLIAEALESSNNGRLLYINMKERTHEVLLDGLFFPNGVQVDLRDGGKESVLFAETWRNRISRVFVAGPRRGEVELFADNLPGMPDNIRPTEARDGYWVAISIVRAKEVPSRLDWVSTWPSVRQLIHKALPVPLIHHYMRSYYGLALKLDLEGRIVASLHDNNGSAIRDLTEVTEHGGTLYLGNYDAPYLGRLEQTCKSRKSCPFATKPKKPKSSL